MDGMKRKAAVFIILGQSNAVGHGVPMREEDRITDPLSNVFGLRRSDNQGFWTDRLYFSGYTSGGMNLGETQDHTYSVPNQLARVWQDAIDGGRYALPDLYIIQIAIGAQGVTKPYMWHPDREMRMKPGKLGEVDISLFPFTCHVFSLLESSFAAMGVDYEIIGLHWRGGEEDTGKRVEVLSEMLTPIYRRILDAFSRQLGDPPIVLHRIAARDRMFDMDASGERYRSMAYINGVFDELAADYPNVSVFDVCRAPQYHPDVRGNGLFIGDAVHFTPEVNRWVAEEILREYVMGRDST